MGTPDFEKWLDREEETFGLTGAITRTIDPGRVRDMLREELGYDPTESQVDAFYEAARSRYETMPQIGVKTFTVTTYKGTIRERWDLWYRDIATGRRVGLEAVQERLRLIGLY